jgi:hypothetical protein
MRSNDGWLAMIPGTAWYRMAIALEWERTLGGTNPTSFSHAEWKQHHRRRKVDMIEGGWLD